MQDMVIDLTSTIHEESIYIYLIVLYRIVKR
jgi:hypothetical protein